LKQKDAPNLAAQSLADHNQEWVGSIGLGRKTSCCQQPADPRLWTVSPSVGLWQIEREIEDMAIYMYQAAYTAEFWAA